MYSDFQFTLYVVKINGVLLIKT